MIKVEKSFLILIFRTADFRQTLKGIVDEAVESRFRQEKQAIDAKLTKIDNQFEEQKKDYNNVTTILAQMNASLQAFMGKKQKAASPSDESEGSPQPGPSGRSLKQKSRERSQSKTASRSLYKSSSRKRDRTPSPTKSNKRSKKSKEERTTRKESATSNLRDQQVRRTDFTNVVTSLPKWLTEDSDINPMGYIAARFGYIHEECRAYARSKNEKGQTYAEWRNYFHSEAHHQVKDFDETSGRMYYTMKKAGKKPTLKLIVPKWFKRQKNRPVAQINPKTDAKNVLVWHTDMTFLDNFYLDCGGKQL